MGAEASAKFTFAFALQPYFRIDALASLHSTDAPSESFAVDLRLRCGLYIGNAIWKRRIDDDIAYIITGLNDELERVLIAEHAHLRVFPEYVDAVCTAQFIRSRMFALCRHFAKGFAARRRANRFARWWACRLTCWWA